MATRIEPDLQFIKELQAVGGDSLKKCYQCATCSVACPISPASAPYPRKEMIWAQWGLKDKLLSDIDIWLCHNCGTCSDLCPRGAKPGDLLAALRNMAYQNLAGCGFIAKAMRSASGLPLLIGIPAILLGLVWILRGIFGNGFFPTTENGDIVYSLLFPGDYTIDPIFTATFLFMVFMFFKGTKNLINSLKPEGEVVYVGERKHWVKHLIEVIFGEIMSHEKFQDCGEDKADRKIGHMCLLFGFAALAVVTGVVAVGHWGGYNLSHWLGFTENSEGPIAQLIYGFGHITHTPMSQVNLIKVIANIGAILLLIGLSILTFRRLNLDDKKSVSSFYDWYLLGVIWAVTLTGLGSEVLRLAGAKYLAYPVYYFHLIAVWMLFAYLPWSKLGHLVYRTAAITYARYMGRKTM